MSHFHETTYQWTDSRGQVWPLVLSWANIGGRLECVGVQVGADALDLVRPITAIALRELPIGRIIEAERETARGWALFVSHDPEAPPAAVAAAGRVLRVKRPPTSAEYRALRTAVTYSRAWEQGVAPVRAVAEEWTIARSTAGRYVEQARNEHGYLEPTEPGQPNATLTAKARKLLAKFGDDWTEWEAAIAAHEQGKG